MQKTRVLFTVLQLDAGGSERVVFDLARSLDPSEFEVFVAAFKGGVLAQPLKEICREVFFIEKKPGFDLSAMLKLSIFIRNNEIDVVNAHHYMPCFYSFLGTKILNDKQLVYTEHSVPEVENIAGSIHGKIFHWMLYRINAVVGVSKAITEKFKEIYPRHSHKFHEILNGVDIERFRRKRVRENVRNHWGLAKEAFVIGSVANFRKIKNHVCLVRAVGRLKESHPYLRLFFVGTGFPSDLENSEEEVRELVRNLGLEDKVIFAGYQENIPETLSAFDAFCLPSLSEGLPVSLLEAMAAGVPVIGSEVSGIKEVILTGKTGMLFPSNDDRALSRIIEKYMDNRPFAQALSDRALSFISKTHNCKEWIKAYSRVIKSKSIKHGRSNANFS